MAFLQRLGRLIDRALGVDAAVTSSYEPFQSPLSREIGKELRIAQLEHDLKFESDKHRRDVLKTEYLLLTAAWNQPRGDHR